MEPPVIEVRRTAEQVARSLRADVVAGLTAPEKCLPPKWFYDARGSALFEQITQLPEYYPTRAEREILDARATELVEATRATSLVELGSGYSTKTRLLLDAFTSAGQLREFVTLDVSEAPLREAAESIAADYPGLSIRGVVADFTERLEISAWTDQRPRLVAFLGGTIGNLYPDERRKFLSAVRGSVHPGDWLLLGTDLVKSPDVLVPAYDDAAGVTAEFNRNVLAVLNRELDADFDPDRFDHRAVWNAEAERIEMRLRARERMRIRLPAVDLEVWFDAGEEVLTEISTKFREERVRDELTEAGFRPRRWWTDQRGRFALSLAEVTG